MATYKRYRKEDQVSYSLGITLTFELLKFKKESVTRVFIHSGMKKGDTLDKLTLLCNSISLHQNFQHRETISCLSTHPMQVTWERSCEVH